MSEAKDRGAEEVEEQSGRERGRRSVGGKEALSTTGAAQLLPVSDLRTQLTGDKI